MNLDEAQRRTVAEWIEQGFKIADIQNKLQSELGIRMTYMDVRFMIDDLKLKPKDPEPPKAASPLLAGAAQKPATPSAPSKPGAASPPPTQQPLTAAVSVKVDQVAKPGALVSGKVTFTDGKAADWYLDQYGRLGMVPDEQGYRPSQEDLMEFQTELQEQLGRLGY